MITAKLLAEKCFGGWIKRFNHNSTVLNCEMTFSIFLPPAAAKTQVPAVYWLGDSGDDDASLMRIYMAQFHAAQLGLALICPDVHPRGEYVPDLTSRLGKETLPALYLNATSVPWQRHFRLFDYVQSELPGIVESHFPISSRKSICGVGWGAHGAMVLALSQPQKYSCVSGLNPRLSIVADSVEARMLALLMGDNPDAMRQYDITELLALSLTQLPVLFHQVEQGLTSVIAAGQRSVLDAAKAKGYPLELIGVREYSVTPGFIASFIGQHLKFHSLYL
ncbi:alpha/beta hydrolase-fold protein [Shewanella sp. GXUN23E]|uniref:alpha/beta hydrolase-fold protein n=1 Tax=Shewanella sp. GXUN23E TaxID=3422498 RepID=UPI003D7DE7BC